jgi:hypothetical protein
MWQNSSAGNYTNKTNCLHGEIKEQDKFMKYLQPFGSECFVFHLLPNNTQNKEHKSKIFPVF